MQPQVPSCMTRRCTAWQPPPSGGYAQGMSQWRRPKPGPRPTTEETLVALDHTPRRGTSIHVELWMAPASCCYPRTRAAGGAVNSG